MKKFLTVLIFLLFFALLPGQDKFTDKRDGNVYRTITVAGVTWMAENLRFKTDKETFYFDNDSNNMPGYGVLYSWKIAVNICPDNWHLPSGADFRALSNYYDNTERWGKVASEPSSFGIQFGGMQDYEGTFSEMDESAYYWTSTEYDTNNAEYFSYLLIDKMPVIDISRKEDIADIHGTEKSNKYSVRCVKN